MTSPFSRVDLEPPPWFYTRMARGPLFRRIYRRFLADLANGLPAGARLLDIGTGPGYLLGYLSALRPDLRLFGLDPSHRMLHRGKRLMSEISKNSWPRVAARAESLPFPGPVFDHALTTFSFHLWRRPELGVAEIVRVLRPGGRAWLYEMKREATSRELRDFAREENLPYPLVYLGYLFMRWPHALRAGDFARVFREAGVARWQVQPAHHLFWRGEIQAG